MEIFSLRVNQQRERQRPPPSHLTLAAKKKKVYAYYSIGVDGRLLEAAIALLNCLTPPCKDKFSEPINE